MVKPILVAGTKATRCLSKTGHPLLEPASARLPGAPFGGSLNFKGVTLGFKLLGV